MNVKISRKFVYTVNGQVFNSKKLALEAWEKSIYDEFWTAQGFTPDQVAVLTEFCKDPMKSSALRSLLSNRPSFDQESEND